MFLCLFVIHVCNFVKIMKKNVLTKISNTKKQMKRGISNPKHQFTFHFQITKNDSVIAEISIFFVFPNPKTQ